MFLNSSGEGSACMSNAHKKTLSEDDCIKQPWRASSMTDLTDVKFGVSS